MPTKPKRPCIFPGCGKKTDRGGYCSDHSYMTSQYRQKDNRSSSAVRGYDADWKKIRAEILRSAGIPRELWHLYDVHHEPNYNPTVEPNHRMYKLTPLLHSEHSSTTGKNRGRRGKSLGILHRDRSGSMNFYSCKIGKIDF